jgi:hypothetical protein
MRRHHRQAGERQQHAADPDRFTREILPGIRDISLRGAGRGDRTFTSLLRSYPPRGTGAAFAALAGVPCGLRSVVC